MSHVRIYEVGPRDGLQNEKAVISVDDKVELIKALVDAGLKDIEVGSFVSPKWVPQMADTDRVMAALDYANDLNYATLVPNVKGWEGFVQASANLPRNAGEIAVFIAASEGFSKANLNCTVEESLSRLVPVVEAAQNAGVPVRGYVSCITDCPFDGPTPPEAVVRAVEGLRGLAPMPVSLGDTIGAGTPETVTRVIKAVAEVMPIAEVAGHFHDTGGRALDNVQAALELGVRVFDAAVGGLGGCPYAPGAPGNVATEAVVERVEGLGYSTGLDHAALARAGGMARKLRG
ncbi:hydroxymethylglutaryl-CoA lyase [Marivivens donghaensis]|jgi:hydroxymethylglutaryl-CoA lyase|uniref:hydroxymethylglutaryl-CoA lyase n=1 Tax=Marivivens donghaensis TaxID=1699413 RepID=UPI003F699BF4